MAWRRPGTSRAAWPHLHDAVSPVSVSGPHAGIDPRHIHPRSPQLLLSAGGVKPPLGHGALRGKACATAGSKHNFVCFTCCQGASGHRTAPFNPASRQLATALACSVVPPAPGLMLRLVQHMLGAQVALVLFHHLQASRAGEAVRWYGPDWHSAAQAVGRPNTATQSHSTSSSGPSNGRSSCGCRRDARAAPAQPSPGPPCTALGTAAERH